MTFPKSTYVVERIKLYVDNINRFFNEGPKDFKRPQMALDREVLWKEHACKYMAVRNHKKEYIGTLELVQDLTFAKEYFLSVTNR